MSQQDKHAYIQATLATAETKIYEAVNAFSGGKLEDGEKIISMVITDLEMIGPELSNESDDVQETAKEVTARAFMVRSDLNEADYILHPWHKKH